MLERFLPTGGSQAKRDITGEVGEDGGLRPFDWAELVARISATSDLRQVTGYSRRNSSFASFAAEAGGDTTEKTLFKQQAEQIVNPNLLQTGKDVAGTVAAPASAATDTAPYGNRNP